MTASKGLRRTLSYVHRVRLSRANFQGKLKAILGTTSIVWMPKITDTTTAVSDDSVGHTFTWDATVAARLSALRNGVAQSFDGVGQYGTTVDAADLSFGNGAADSAFSIVALANVTDTAAVREFLTKWSGAGGREWEISITAADVLSLRVFDDSAAVGAVRNSDSAITQGSWRLFGASYDGTGGATAANGMTLYQDGAVIASTATNNASYVAMENLGSACEIGSIIVHTTNFFAGSMAMVLLCQKALSATEHSTIAKLCHQFYGVP